MYILKIDGHTVDFKEDISIKFNYANSDASDPAAVKNAFSYTVKLPGTATNNKIFGDIWKCNRTLVGSNYSMSMSNFNQKKKVPFVLTFDGQLIETGYVKLNKVTSNFFMQEYDITLYGGIGDFFYSLQTNLDGSKKSLADLYYGFAPMISYGSVEPVLNEEEEASQVLFRWTADNIAASWHYVANMSEPTAATNVANFITAVPCYTGLYEDFSSDEMLINNFIRWDNLLSDHTVSLFDQSLPTGTTEDNVTYTIYQDPNSQYKSSYSKIKFPREINPIEAGDLRATELPIAIKLSKVLDAIAATGNNGGYSVEYSTSITSSNYWKYGWIMLNKPDFKDVTDYIGDSMSITGAYTEGMMTPNQGPHVWPHANQEANVTWETSPNDISFIPGPILNIGFNNRISILEPFSTGETIDPSKLPNISNNWNWGHIAHEGGPDGDTYVVTDGEIWHGIFCLVQMYDGNTLMQTNGVLLHIHNPIGNLGESGGFARRWRTKWEPLLLDRMNSYFGTNLVNLHVHDAIQTKVNNDGTISYKNDVIEQIDINFTSTDFNVKISPVPVMYVYSEEHPTWYNGTGEVRIPYIDSLITEHMTASGQFANIRFVQGQTTPYHYGWLYTNYGEYEPRYGDYAQYVHHKTEINFNSSEVNNGVIGTNLTWGFYVNATKKNLLANSPSPFEALTSLTKLLNLKYIYDRQAKRINVVTSKEYWLNRTIDLKDRVDYSRDLTHNLVLSNNKYLDMSYPVNNLYPLYLWKKNNDRDYESFVFDTGFEFNSDKKKFFENCYRQSALYQVKSQFLMQFADYLPSIFGTNVFDYTLYHKNNDGSLDELTQQSITGNDNPNAKTYGPTLLCNFDKGQSTVEAVFPSLVFLSGFFKNWRLVSVSKEAEQSSDMKMVVPILQVSNDFKAMSIINSDRCYLWSYMRTAGTFPGWGYMCENSATAWALPYFSRDLVGFSAGSIAWYGSDRVLSSWDIVYDPTKYYDEQSITFVRYPASFNLPSTAITDPATYTITNLDKSDDSEYLYNKFWKTQLEDMYDDNGRELEVWIDLKAEDPITALRQFYKFDNCIWIIEKIDGYERRIIDRNYCKCKLLKVHSINNYLNIGKEEKQNAIIEKYKTIIATDEEFEYEREHEIEIPERRIEDDPIDHRI
jgi:hypothetical protein